MAKPMPRLTKGPMGKPTANKNVGSTAPVAVKPDARPTNIRKDCPTHKLPTVKHP